MCSTQEQIWDALRQGKYSPIYKVLNARVVMGQEEFGNPLDVHSMWYLIPFFVNIKTLSIQLL